MLEIIQTKAKECHLAKVDVEGSNPFSRSRFREVRCRAACTREPHLFPEWTRQFRNQQACAVEGVPVGMDRCGIVFVVLMVELRGIREEGIVARMERGVPRHCQVPSWERVGSGSV